MLPSCLFRRRFSLSRRGRILWRDFRLAVFGKEIVEGFSHDPMQGIPVLNSENLELVAHLLWKVDGDGTGPSPPLWHRRFCYRCGRLLGGGFPVA